MKISVTSSETVKVSFDRDERVLRLRTGELEWKLLCTTALNYRNRFRGGLTRDDVLCLDSTFKLVPLHGMNFLRTASFSLTLTIEGGRTNSRGCLAVNKNHIFRIFPKSGEELGETLLTIGVDIILEMGEMTSVGNSNRLFNSSELSDVMLKCGDLRIPAHKHILSTHSETFRTVFNSSSFVEGQEGLYEVSSEHMRPEVLEDVVRY
jgi:BTB/POZ domain